jgi:hypothetical protein
MMAATKCLFGGALLGAGLCSSATGATVDWIGGFGSAVASDGGIGNDFDSLSGTGWDAMAAYGTASARASADTFGIDMAADGGTGTANATTFGSFTVVTDTTMLLSWDVDQLLLLFIDVSTGIVLDLNLFSEAGSVEFTFLTGTTYNVNVYISSFGSGPPSTFTMNTVNVVPLPPAAFGGLAMLAGLGAYRRVRRRA